MNQSVTLNCSQCNSVINLRPHVEQLKTHVGRFTGSHAQALKDIISMLEDGRVDEALPSLMKNFRDYLGDDHGPGGEDDNFNIFVVTGLLS